LENNSTIWGYQLNSIDIYIYVYIYLESHNPIFLGQTALTIFFGHYGFDRLEPLVWELLRLFTAFFQQNVEKIRFCHG
jgi:hypothetical protein